MQAKIETLKAKDAQSNEYLLYPRTLTDCITDSNGTGFVDVVRAIPVANAITADRATYDAAGNNIAESFTKLQDGTVNAGDSAKLGGETATQWQTKLDNIQTTSRAVLSQAGWYRVAKYESDQWGVVGTYCNSCSLVIKKANQNSTGAYYDLHLVFASGAKIAFECIESATNPSYNPIPKIRYTREGVTAYIEIYMSENKSNQYSFTVTNGSGQIVGIWQAITPTATAEEVDGVTVTTTYDIPANASPATSVDLANYLPKTGGAQYKAAYLYNYLRTDLRDVLYGIDDKGVFLVLDQTNGKQIIQSTANGTTNFYGTLQGTATGNLPLSGNSNITGTVKFTGNGSDSPIEVNGTYTTTRRALIRYMYASSQLGYMGFDEDGTPIMMNSSGLKNLLHSGNYADYALPKIGGMATGLTIAGGDGQAYVTYNTGNTRMGHLGFIGANNPVLIKNDDATVCSLIHSGNSAKVVQATTAPTDTSALWVDTANKKVKSYVDGAWTVIA